MEEWKQYKLIDVLDTLIDYRGKTPRKTMSGIPLITAKIIKNGRIDTPNEFIAIEDYDSWMVRGFPKVGDVVVTTEAPLGEVAQLDDENVALAQRVVTLRGKAGVLDNTYLKYFLLSHVGQQRLKARETGTTVTGIKQSELREVLIDCPPYETQIKIASVLSSLDDKIEINKRINDNLEKQVQALFKSWFVDFEPFKDGEFEESELGFIPKGWSLYEFGRVLSPVNEKVGDKIVTEYSVGNTGIRSRSDIYHKTICSNPEKNRIIRKGDLVFGMGNDRVTWGIMKDEIGATSPAYPVFQIDKDIDYIYFEFFFKHFYAQSKDLIRPSVRQGQTIDKGALMQKKIYMPPKNVWDRFLHIHNPIIETSRCVEIESNRLSDLRDMLLPHLMSGILKESEMNA